MRRADRETTLVEAHCHGWLESEERGWPGPGAGGATVRRGVAPRSTNVQLPDWASRCATTGMMLESQRHWGTVAVIPQARRSLTDTPFCVGASVRRLRRGAVPTPSFWTAARSDRRRRCGRASSLTCVR